MEETHIRKYKINISWTSGTLQTLEEAKGYLTKVIIELGKDWCFNISGEVV